MIIINRSVLFLTFKRFGTDFPPLASLERLSSNYLEVRDLEADHLSIENRAYSRISSSTSMMHLKHFPSTWQIRFSAYPAPDYALEKRECGSVNQKSYDSPGYALLSYHRDLSQIYCC